MEFKTSTKPLESKVLGKLITSEDKPEHVEKCPQKFVVLTFRKYTDLEWETFESWGLRVYEYTKTSAAGSSIDKILSSYDVILINPFNTEALQFWNLSNLGFPRKDVHVMSLVTKRCSCSEIERYKIQSQVKYPAP